MKKVLIFMLTVVLSNGFAAAQSSVWKVTKDGNTLFMAGSVHTLRDEDFPLPEEFDMAFDNSEVLTIETDVEKLSDPQIAQYLAAKIVLPKKQTLKSVLKRDVYKKLDLKCREFGLSIDSFARIKPSMVVTVLSVVQMQRSGFVQQGVDDHYLAKAKEAGKRIDFLESIDIQIAAIISMGKGYDNEYVLYSLQDMESTGEKVSSLISGWRNGTPDSLETDLRDMMEQWPELYKTLVYDRNMSWIPVLEGYLANEPVEFVIAGLLHFYGPDGLLKQLENAGCEIEQVVLP